MKLVEFVVVENMNAVKSVQQLVTLNVCLYLVRTITVQTLQTEAGLTEQIQRKVSLACEISKETSIKTKEAICEYVN